MRSNLGRVATAILLATANPSLGAADGRWTSPPDMNQQVTLADAQQAPLCGHNAYTDYTLARSAAPGPIIARPREDLSRTALRMVLERRVSQSSSLAPPR